MSPSIRLPCGLWAGACALALLAGCESVPAPGDTVHAQVTAVPRSRADLDVGFTYLHAALRAGVTRAQAGHGRLLRAQCGDADAASPGGVRWRSATVALPDGVTVASGAVVEIDALRWAHPTAMRPHGRFVATLPALDPAQSLPGFDGTPRPMCRPPGLADGRWRVQVAGIAAPWELDFARAELARHDSLSDAELAAGRVVQVSCQLKVMDGRDWTRVTWLARVPEGPPPHPGDVVRLRTGAEEFGQADGPLAQVLGRADDRAAPGGNAIVRCR